MVNHVKAAASDARPSSLCFWSLLRRPLRCGGTSTLARGPVGLFAGEHSGPCGRCGEKKTNGCRQCFNTRKQRSESGVSVLCLETRLPPRVQVSTVAVAADSNPAGSHDPTAHTVIMYCCTAAGAA